MDQNFASILALYVVRAHSFDVALAWCTELGVNPIWHSLLVHQK